MDMERNTEYRTAKKYKRERAQKSQFSYIYPPPRLLQLEAIVVGLKIASKSI